LFRTDKLTTHDSMWSYNFAIIQYCITTRKAKLLYNL